MGYKLNVFDLPINSGALVQLRRRGGELFTVTVAPSAAAHVSPRYPYSAEAPRVVGAYFRCDYRRAWLEWVAHRIGWDESMLDWRCYRTRDREAAVRRYIRDHYQDVPDRGATSCKR